MRARELRLVLPLAVAGAAGVGFGVFVWLATPAPISCGGALDDMENAGIVVRSILIAPSVPVCPDGRIDVYAVVVGDGPVPIDTAKLFHNEAADLGPTPREVEARDYTQFAWGRARADGVDVDGPRVPLLWYDRPHHGERMVAFSDGSVRIIRETEFQALGVEDR